MGTVKTRSRLAISGCGRAAHIHVERLAAIDTIEVVGCADPDVAAARGLASRITELKNGVGVPAFADHRELIEQVKPTAVAIFTPHLSHYRPAMDALQAGCHIFVEKPLSTNVQEAADIVKLAKGRKLKVGVGHQYRLRPSFAEAKRLLATGAIGKLSLVTATLAQPWLASHGGAENSWRFDPKIAGGGILADAGDQLIDTLLWTTGQLASEVAAFQSKLESGLDLVSAAAIRLADGTPVTLAISGVSPGAVFELNYFGDEGRISATDVSLRIEIGAGPNDAKPIDLPISYPSIDANFAAALTSETPLCCPAEEALDTVRLLEAIIRSAVTGQVVRVS